MASSDLNTDALSAVGVKYLDMPATPHRVWSATQAAKHSARRSFERRSFNNLQANADQGD
jgi:hypothetical protein